MRPTTAPTSFLETAFETIAERFQAGFSEERPVLRTVGREAEFPIVSANGEAVDARRLWNTLLVDRDLEPEFGAGRPGERDFIVGLKGPDYSYMLEVGLSTVEITTRPCQDLLEVEQIVTTATRRLVNAAAHHGWRVLGYGIQPVTPPGLRILSPKERYLSLYRAMGNPWLWYTVTAADQLHVAISRDEAVSMLNYGNLVTPIIVALCANSPVYAGELSPYCSAREGVMAEIRANEHRHGMALRPYRDLADYVGTVSQSTYLIVRDGGQIIPSSQPFSTFLQEHGPDFPAFLFHEHYVWNSARLRTTFGTLEMRPACQQPWSAQMAGAALTLGLIEASQSVRQHIESVLGPAYWDLMRIYHQQVVRFGLAAPEPAPDLLSEIVTLARHGLAARGRGEEQMLAPIFGRLYRSMNPAQHLRAIFRVEGIRGLLNHASIRPAMVDHTL